MKLSYRGQSYEAQSPVVDAPSVQFEGQFLGQSFTLNRYQVRPQSSAAHRLNYRGVDYTK